MLPPVRIFHDYPLRIPIISVIGGDVEPPAPFHLPQLVPGYAPLRYSDPRLSSTLYNARFPGSIRNSYSDQKLWRT